MKNKVMIADDDEDLLFLMKHLLEQSGFKVYLCVNGESLVEKIAYLHPDVVLLDLSMIGNDGSRLCHQIKTDERTHEIKILIVSGNQNIESVASSCGADGYIKKPFDFTMIEGRISNLLTEA